MTALSLGRGNIMGLNELKKLTLDLEKILDALRVQTDPEVRKQFFQDFKTLYFRIKKELI